MVMEKCSVREIFYRVFTVIEFAAVFAMAAIFIVSGIIG